MEVVLKRVYLANISGAYQIVLPYSSGLLHAYCLSDDTISNRYSFQDYIFHVPNGIEEEVKRISNPSVLGLSLLSWNLRRSLKLAKLVKEKYPDCLVVVGGPEVPDVSSEFLKLHPYIDLAVHKEGEETFRQILIENLKVHKNWDQLSGISFRSDAGIVSTPRRHGFLSPISTPSPYLLGLFDEAVKFVDFLNLPRVNVWETNRGCPYSCTFCDWGSATNQRIRMVPEERVHLEIEHLSSTYDEIHLADANFGVHKRDLDFASQMAKKMKSGGRLKSAHINYVKNLNDTAIEIAETLELLKLSRAGFTFAFNSLNKESLKQIKRYNIPREKFISLKKRFDSKNIPTNAELILGLPGETPKSFLEGFEFCMESGLTDIRTYQLNVYPNSELANERTRATHQLTTDWIKIFNGLQPDEDEYIETVTSTDLISSEQMRKIKKTVELIDIIHFGRWTYYLARYLKKCAGIPFTEFYMKMLEYFLEKPESIIAKIVTGTFINEYNSGAWNAYKGPHSPFGINWGHNFFRKSTFFWLCIAEKRDQFFTEIQQFVYTISNLDSCVDDLLKFQKDMIIEFEYDPQLGKSSTYDFNWHQWFKGNAELKRVQNVLKFKDTTVGRFEKKISPQCPESFFYVAGGYDFHFEKMNSFEFRNIEAHHITTVRDDHSLSIAGPISVA